jgi:hypothetical protein
MAIAQNTLIVLPGGIMKSPSIKIPVAQYRRISRFCKNSGWTVGEALERAVSNFLNDEASVCEEDAQRRRLSA